MSGVFLVLEEHFVCRSVTNSPVIGPCSALKFPLAIYKDEPIKPKSFAQISTNFLLSTFEFNSFFSSVFARLCELCQKRTLKDPLLKPLNVLLNICPKTIIDCCSFDMKRPQIQRHIDLLWSSWDWVTNSGLLRLLGKWPQLFTAERFEFCAVTFKESQSPAQECKT